MVTYRAWFGVKSDSAALVTISFLLSLCVCVLGESSCTFFSSKQRENGSLVCSEFAVYLSFFSFWKMGTGKSGISVFREGEKWSEGKCRY